MKKLSIILLGIVILGSCARNPVTGKKDFILMSEGQENAMGAQADPSIVAEYGLYEDAKLQAFINEKGKEMGKISHRPNLNYSFKILDSPIVNAFAVPGGYIYFTRGIMAHFNNEAEFAGVLGHEIGHVTARHTAQQQSKQILAQAGLILGMVVSETFAQFADLANTGLSLLFLKFSRSHEAESDRLGVYYSTKVGYDAHEMADFFKTLQALSGGKGNIPDFMSTHPDPGDRFVNVHKHAEDVQIAENKKREELKVNRESYLKLIDGIIVGEDPRQGYFENNAFYHPELKFTFVVPSGWQTANSPSQVQMAPSDGKAIMFLQLENANSLEQAASNVIQRNKINVEDRANVNVNGLPGIALYGTITQASQNGQQGQSLRMMIYLIQYNNLIYKLVGLSTAQDFNNYFATFQTTMKSFKQLTDPSKLNRVPDRLKIVPVKSTASLGDALRAYNQPESKLKELSVLNGMDLKEVVQTGYLIKTIESKK